MSDGLTSHLSRSWYVCSEQGGDNVVAVDTVNQPLAVIMDEPAGNFGADADILAVVSLGAPGGGRDTTIHRVSQMAAMLTDLRSKKGVKWPILGVQNSLVKNKVA